VLATGVGEAVFFAGAGATVRGCTACAQASVGRQASARDIAETRIGRASIALVRNSEVMALPSEIEELVLGVLDGVLDFDAAQSEHGLTSDHNVANRDTLITLQQLLAGLEHRVVLGDAALRAGLVGVRLALELGAFGVLGPGHGRRFLISGFPFLQRLVALGEPLVELVDSLTMLLLDLPYLGLGGIDLGFRGGLLAIGSCNPGLQCRALVLQLPDLCRGAPQRLAQAVGFGIGPARTVDVRRYRKGDGHKAETAYPHG
jgi:hypothetical protein